MAEVFENLLTRGEGPLFWLSLVAVALGVALIVGALSWQLRRIFARGVTAGTVAAAPEARPAWAEGAAAYGSTAVAQPVDGPKTGDDLLTEVVTRLQTAAERLESMTRDFSIEDENTLESPLKPTDDDVEYVFKASTL